MSGSGKLKIMRAKAVILLWCSLSMAAGPRVRQSFNAGWLFARQSQGTGELGSFDRQNSTASVVEPRFLHAMDPAYDDAWWQLVALPHTWNAQDVMDQKSGYWRGIG